MIQNGPEFRVGCWTWEVHYLLRSAPNSVAPRGPASLGSHSRSNRALQMVAGLRYMSPGCDRSSCLVGGREEQEGSLTQEDSLPCPAGEPRIPRKILSGGKREEIGSSSVKMALTLSGTVQYTYWELFTTDWDFLGMIPHFTYQVFANVNKRKIASTSDTQLYSHWVSRSACSLGTVKYFYT